MPQERRGEETCHCSWTRDQLDILGIHAMHYHGLLRTLFRSSLRRNPSYQTVEIQVERFDEGLTEVQVSGE